MLINNSMSKYQSNDNYSKNNNNKYYSKIIKKLPFRMQNVRTDKLYVIKVEYMKHLIAKSSNPMLFATL